MSESSLQAVEYFNTLREWCVDAAAPAASAMAALGLHADALHALTTALEEAPHSEILLHAVTDLYLSRGEQVKIQSLTLERVAHYTLSRASYSL